MSRSSVEQDPETGLWCWFDETWDLGGYGFQTEEQAKAEQWRYCENVLGYGTQWRPKIGDYVWWIRYGLYPGCPSQVIRPFVSIEDNFYQDRWVIRSLTGSQEEQRVFADALEPMNAMEVLAIVHAWPDVIL